MRYTVACSCGNVLQVSEGMAGSVAACRCGGTVQVPSLAALRGEAIAPAVPSPYPDCRLTNEPPLDAHALQADNTDLPSDTSLDLCEDGQTFDLTGGEVVAAAVAVLLIPLLSVVWLALTTRSHPM